MRAPPRRENAAIVALQRVFATPVARAGGEPADGRTCGIGSWSAIVVVSCAALRGLHPTALGSMVAAGSTDAAPIADPHARPVPRRADARRGGGRVLDGQSGARRRALQLLRRACRRRRVTLRRRVRFRLRLLDPFGRTAGASVDHVVVQRLRRPGASQRDDSSAVVLRSASRGACGCRDRVPSRPLPHGETEALFLADLILLRSSVPFRL
jgi:hypothetical protein